MKHTNCQGIEGCKVRRYWDMCKERQKQIKTQRLNRADPLKRRRKGD